MIIALQRNGTLRAAPLSRIQRFLRDSAGAAMAEFALILPVLMIFLLGGYTVLQTLSIYRRMSDTTAEIANIVTQYTTETPTELQAQMAAAAQVMYPYSTANMTMVTTEVSVDANGNATVTWSQGWNGGKCITAGTTYALPAGLNVANSTYIAVKSNYTWSAASTAYTPAVAPMSHQIYMVPRQSSTIPCAACIC